MFRLNKIVTMKLFKRLIKMIQYRGRRLIIKINQMQHKV